MLLAEDDRADLFSAAPSRLPPQHELPHYARPAIGRSEEVGQIVSLLTSGPARVVTLTGPGGVGKTRVAVEAATAAARHFASGARWVHAMSFDDVDLFATAVRTALGVDSTANSLEAALDRCPDPELLLVLDGVETFLETAASVCDTLLTRTTRLQVLVTSRERLHLSRELPMVLAPLSCLTSDEVAPALEGTSAAADDVAPLTDRPESPASRLFHARATRASKPDAHTSLRLSPADAAAAQRICERVEGIPLAIELAAARTTLLTFTELANALDRSLRYLYVSHADDEIALRDVMIADSFPRLNPAEKLLLSRLSVFCGQFTSGAAAAICLDDRSATDGVDTLSLLVSKSLVLRGDDVAGVATFRLLRVIREFAEDRFASDPDSYQVRRRFAHYFRDLAARAAPHFVDGGQETWSSVLDAESDDLRRAFAWCLRHDPHSALAMVGSLWRWWHLRGHYQEGRTSATAAVRASSSAPARLRGHALTAAGMLALLQCDYDAAQSHIQQGLDLYSFAADHAGVRWSLALLGQVAVQRGEYTVGGQLHEQALVLARRTQDPREVAIQQNALAQVAWLRGDFVQAADRAQSALDTLSALDDQQGVVWGLINLGIAARYRGDLAGAQDLLTHSLRRSERSNYREGVAWSLNQLGVVSRLNQDYQTARAQQDRSLDGHRVLGNRWRAASALDELAALAIATGDVESATIQLAEAAQLRHEIGAPLPLAEQPAREHTLAEARRRNAPASAVLTLAGSPQHHR